MQFLQCNTLDLYATHHEREYKAEKKIMKAASAKSKSNKSTTSLDMVPRENPHFSWDFLGRAGVGTKNKKAAAGLVKVHTSSQ